MVGVIGDDLAERVVGFWGFSPDCERGDHQHHGGDATQRYELLCVHALSSVMRLGTASTRTLRRGGRIPALPAQHAPPKLCPWTESRRGAGAVERGSLKTVGVARRARGFESHPLRLISGDGLSRQPFRRRRYAGKGQPMEEQPTKITPYRNGPYLVRGPFVLVDQDGNEIEVNRRVVALCRCGRSRSRPFCDGTHKTAGFRADSAVAPAPRPGSASDAA